MALRSRRSYNRLYTIGRLVIQIQQGGFDDGVKVELFPQVILAINNHLIHFGVGFEWLFGNINFGWARKSFVEVEKQRHARLQADADELGITKRQQELRWGW
jgi:hypothetical protein